MASIVWKFKNTREMGKMNIGGEGHNHNGNGVLGLVFIVILGLAFIVILFLSSFLLLL
jgi:hypothetical protein